MPRLEVAPALTIELLLLEILEGWTRSYPQYRIAAEIASSPKQAVALAGSVARFLDELEIEGIDPRELSSLFGGDAAHHHDAAVGFLDHVRKELPAALHSRGLVSETAARSARLRRRAAELETRSDTGPIIIAGSTGTVPATRALMKSALASEQGWVVLPGLDLELDAASWAAVGPQHPQFAMRQLLAELARDRSLVEEVAPAPEASRRWLLREMMRPPETLFHWSASSGQNGRARAALADLELIEAADPKEEADVVALILRSVVETPGRSVAVVTPDRSLARRIRVAGAPGSRVCRRRVHPRHFPRPHSSQPLPGGISPHRGHGSGRARGPPPGRGYGAGRLPR
jgi:ATP-dependent helicase/nuclease subunit B